MPIIRYKRDPLLGKTEVNTVDSNVNLLDWIVKNKPELSAGAIIYLNSVCICDTSKDNNAEGKINIKLGQFDEVDLYARPNGGTILTAAAFTLTIVGSAVKKLFEQPDIPEVKFGKSSPNDELNAASNRFRKNQAIADLAGNGISYPDFIKPSYFEYINNLKQIKESFVIGVGKYAVTDVKSSTTLINDITGSSYAVVEPNTTPNDTLIVSQSNEVTGQELEAPDAKIYKQTISSVEFTTADALRFADTETIVTDFGLAPGDELEIENGTNAGIYTVDTIVDSGGFITIDFTDSTFSLTTYDVDFAVVPVSPETIINWTDWFILDGETIEDCWFHINMPQGIQSKDAGRISITLRFECQGMSGGIPIVGPYAAFSETITGLTLDAQYRTFKLSDHVTVTGTTGFRVRARRETNRFNDTQAQSVKWEAAASVDSISVSDYGNCTVLELIRRASTVATQPAKSKINLEYSRKLELFDPVTGTFDTGVFTETKSFAQYAMYILVTQMKEPVSNVDYESLFDIEDDLSDDFLGYFTYSFDDKDVSPRERLEICLNAARVSHYKIGSVYKFVREQEQSVRSALFNRRNVAPNSSSQVIKYNRTNEFDSIELTYVDPVKNTEATFQRRINQTTGDIETGLGDRVKEFKLNGCRNADQAENRIEMEIRKLLYLYKSVTDTALSEALTIGAGERVGWADFNDSEIFDGEIISQNGDEFLTSEKFTPDGSTTYYVYITDEDGGTSNSVIATAHPDTEFGFTATGLTSFNADGYEIQLGSRYMIASQSNVTASDFTLVSRGKPGNTGRVSIELEQYDSRVFSED